MHLLYALVGVCWSLFPKVIGRVMGCKSQVACLLLGHVGRHKTTGRPHSHGQFERPDLPLVRRTSGLWEEARSTQRKPIHTEGEQANFTQRAQSQGFNPQASGREATVLIYPKK